MASDMGGMPKYFATSGEVVIKSILLLEPQATIDFLFIPSTFRKLRLDVIRLWNDAGAFTSVGMTFNKDTTNANYRRSIANSASASDRYTGIDAAPTSTSAAFAGNGIIEIPDYADTNYPKTSINVGGASTTAASEVGVLTWNGLAAINQITLFSSSGNFTAGSKVVLVGVL